MKFLQNCKRHQQNNRKGGMLILVLIIFAVSLILISSAMTITLASRSRYYVDTERSQERLTLTCAAETVVGAISTQELPDASLQSMVNNGRYYVTGSTQMSAAAGANQKSGAAISPGLTTAANNDTYFTVTNVPGSTDDLYLTFSTLIDVTGEDGRSENLRVKLKYTPPTPKTQICANMVTAGDPTSNTRVDMQRIFVNTSKSYTVLHGNINICTAGESYVHNTAVFTGNVIAAQGTKFYGDVVFYGSKAGINIKTCGNGFQLQKQSDGNLGSLYFIGGKGGARQKAFQDDKGNMSDAASLNLVGRGIYMENTEFTSSNYTAAGTGDYCKYWVVANNAVANRTNANDGSKNVIIKKGGTVNNKSVTATVYESDADIPETDAEARSAHDQLVARGAKYRDSEELKAAATHSVPTCEEQAATYGSYATGTALNVALYSNKNSSLAGGAYKMSGTYTDGSITIDLSKGDASIYMAGNVTFDNFHITVSNKWDNQLIIVMAKGSTFKIQGEKCWAGLTPGIISCDSRNSTNFTNAWGTDLRAKEGEKPACLIVGLGKNVVSMSAISVVDAYISLAGLGADASNIIFTNGPHYYGRFESVKYEYTGGDGVELQYCPSVEEESNKPKPLSTCYTVEGYEYTYDVA